MTDLTPMVTKLTPIEHFKEMVSEAIRHQKVKTNELAEFYLSRLLAEYVQSENIASEPLAITYLKAMSSGKEVQLQLLRRLGDIALFTSGFFPDSLKRKIVDVDYYMNMGAASYGTIADITGEKKSATRLFGELAAKFGSFADVLSEVSERSRLTSSKDILRVYERWLRTKSSQAERMLRDMGINPINMGTGAIH